GSKRTLSCEMAPKRSSADQGIENITLIGARGVTPLFFQLHSAILWSNQDLITGSMSTRAQVRYSSLHPSVPRKASGFSEYGYNFGNCLCSISCVIVVHLGQVLSVRRSASPNVCSICTGVQESHTCRAGENSRWWTLQ